MHWWNTPDEHDIGHAHRTKYEFLQIMDFILSKFYQSIRTEANIQQKGQKINCGTLYNPYHFQFSYQYEK